MRLIQICGKAPTTEPIARIVGAERWIIGSAYMDHCDGPYDRVFDVHPLAFIHERRPDAWRWYQAQHKPVYLLEANPLMPSVSYPRETIRARFGSRAANALSSSVDQMMALALLEGCDQIRLDGVRMISLEEWVLQRECLGYWIGRAEEMGVEVVTDREAALCTPDRVYGYDEPTGAQRTAKHFVMVQGVPGAA